MNEAYLLLGSNIDPERNILQALEYLQCTFTLLEISMTWQTKPIGSHAADFLNTAVKICTTLDVTALKLRCLGHIEEIMGRVRQADKNAPRTIDLDIIVFNGQILDGNLFELAHLILPFAELLPELKHPVSGKTLSELAGEIHSSDLAKPYKHINPQSILE